MKDWTHWTNRGVFKIEVVPLLGMWHCELSFDGKKLGTYNYLQTAAGSIAKGDHDQVLGFKASGLNVPPSVDAWNNL